MNFTVLRATSCLSIGTARNFWDEEVRFLGKANCGVLVSALKSTLKPDPVWGFIRKKFLKKLLIRKLRCGKILHGKWLDWLD